MNYLFKILIAAIVGISLSFTQAPYDLWFLIFPCFSVLYYFYARLQNKKQIFIYSFVFAVAYFVSGLNWIGNALLVEGNEYRWVWPISVIALPTLLALFTSLYLTINFIIFRNTIFLKFIGFCLFLTFSEFVRGYAFTGFPWNLYGYGLASLPEISQILSLIGPYGLTLMTVLWGSFLGYVVSPKQYRIALSSVCIITLVVSISWGHLRLKNAETKYDDTILFHIVQPNIEQSAKWDNQKIGHNFEKIISTLPTPLPSNKKNIVLWPETAIPPILLSSSAVHQRIQTMLGMNSLLLTGALVVAPNETTLQTNYYNALLAWTSFSSPETIYSKSHLVPFGEYIPFQKYIPLKPVIDFTGFQTGGGSTTIKIADYPSFSPTICYEIIFPNKVVNKSMPRPDYILTITNDGWYGDSAGPRQHFRQARFRAIEQGISVLRSANTGISGIIDPYGRIIKKIDLMTQGSISSSLPLKLDKITVYGRFGDYLYLFISIFALIIGFILKHKQ